jgi:hypothetical protein
MNRNRNEDKKGKGTSEKDGGKISEKETNRG